MIQVHSQRAGYEGVKRKLLEHEVFSLLRKYEIEVAPYGVATTPEEAVAVSREIGYPVVLKVISPDISHKFDVGGVILGLESDEDVREGFVKIYENVNKRAPGSRIVGVLVQKMMPKGLEIIVGALNDVTFGGIVMLGLGGIFTEVYRDVSFRVTPLTEEDAIEMINELNSKQLFYGYRNMPPVNLKSLADLIVKVSKLIDEMPEIDSLDLNPVIGYPDKVVVVDARVILK